MGVPFALPQAMSESSYCSTFSPAISVGIVPDFDHFDRCVVVCNCCFNLHFPDDILCGAFIYLIYLLYIFFGMVSIKVFSSFCNQVVCLLIVKFWEFFVNFE